MIEFKKYSKIKQIGHTDNVDIFKSPKDEIIIQEKVDGSNIRFYITKEGKIIFGSRNQQLTSNKGENTNVEKNFIRCIKHVNEMVFKDLEIKKIKKFSGYIFFGENMIKHTMNYEISNVHKTFVRGRFHRFCKRFHLRRLFYRKPFTKLLIRKSHFVIIANKGEKENEQN